jgi:hypothetical protein
MPSKSSNKPYPRWPLLTRADLRRYQRWLIHEIVVMREIFVALDMSMGKTAIILFAIRRMLYTKISRVLIVGPLKVVEETWPTEILSWKELRVLDWSVITGSPEERDRAMSSPAPIHMINKENLPWLWNRLKKDWPYDMVVWDESSALKSWKKRTPNKKLTRFGAMANARPYVDRMVLLSGTPAPNGVYDLGGQMYILDRGESLGTQRDAFEKRWFESDYMGWTLEPKEHAFDEIMDRCEDVMVSLRAEDYIDMPKRKIVPMYVELPKKIMAEYRRFERTLVSETYDVEAVSKGVLAGKLLQFASGSMYRNYEDGSRDIVKVHDEKLYTLERIVEESAGQNILCAYGHKFDIDLIKKKYPKTVLGSDDKNFIKNWNAGRIRLGLVHPAEIGHGTNLQFGGHIGVWFGLTWSLELWQQFNMRLPRPGQEAHTCFYYPIIARGTADEDCYEAMAEKGATQEKVHDRIRRVIRDSVD